MSLVGVIDDQWFKVNISWFMEMLDYSQTLEKVSRKLIGEWDESKKSEIIIIHDYVDEIILR